ARMSGTMRTPLAWTLRVTISPVNSFEPVFLKVPMVAIFKSPFSGFEPAPLRPRWRSTGRRRSLAHPRLRGLDGTGGTFLLARGMTRLGVPWNMGWGRQGKKVMTTLLHQSDRSAPRALVFGQIRPWKRPLGAVRDTRRTQSLAHSSSAKPVATNARDVASVLGTRPAI